MRFENEECHYLNVWSPTLDPDAKKAVMVYLHGGGFSTGSGADSEMEEMASMSQFGDVVCVSVNHRLNCLGFMDVSDYGEEYKYSGNNGMADIIAALQWVQNNITEFGGDPDNVTIFGQSGGGGKVMTLMGMPSAQGLFHKAIVQSGGAWANTQEDSRKLTAAVMEELGISTVEELKAVDYETLDAACNKMMAELNAAGEISMNFWSPTVDGDLYPELVGTAGGFAEIAKDIPLIIGTTFGEEMSSNGVPLVYNFGPGMYLPEYTEEDVMDQLEMRYSDNAQTIADCFRTAYPGHPLVEVLFLEQRAWSVEEAEKSFSDFIDSNLLAMAKADQNGAPVYSYVFAYTFPAFGGITAPHGAELDFLFHNIEKMKRLTNGEESAYHLQDQVCRAWTNFAKTGDPSQDGLEWEPFTRENGATMIFDAESEVRCFHDKELMEAIIFAPASSGEEASDQAEVAE